MSPVNNNSSTLSSRLISLFPRIRAVHRPFFIWYSPTGGFCICSGVLRFSSLQAPPDTPNPPPFLLLLLLLLHLLPMAILLLVPPSPSCAPPQTLETKAKCYGDGSLFVVNFACRLLAEALDPAGACEGGDGKGMGGAQVSREGFALALQWSLEVTGRVVITAAIDCGNFVVWYGYCLFKWLFKGKRPCSPRQPHSRTI